MIELEELDGGFRVVDAAKNEVTIEIDDWEPGGEELEIGHDVTESLTGRGTEIRLPNAGFLVESSELEDPRMINMNERIRLEPGNHGCRVGTPITVLIRIQSTADVIAQNTKNGIRVFSSKPTSFALGFKEIYNFEIESITVPPTPKGVATSLAACASLHKTETPDRSFPSERPKSPIIEFDDAATASNSGVSEQKNSIRFRMPPSLDFLYPLTPLSFYLGAQVTTERGTEPKLELESEVHELPSDSRFSDEVASLLRRIFYLDCLVREVGPRRLGIKEFDLLDDFPIDPKEIYLNSMSERVRTYLEVPFETIESGLPDWPIATFVEPSVENLPAISFLMDRLSLVFPPRSSPVDQRTWVERSLGDFYRSTPEGTAKNNPIEILSPEANHAGVQGWIASGTPVDAFKCLPEAFENQRDYLAPSSEPISINVVLNDEAMDLEHSKVIQIYRDRAAELSIELDVLEGATTEELATTFESRSDFFHYIGHCDDSGFRCVDGNLAAEEVSRSRARTFFLNACGSYSEGLELIRKGSVAGAVTFGDVIDEQATKVGSNFARLYMLGYTIERSLYHARGQAIMNRQYAIVGNGTHVLTQGDSIQPAVTKITPRPKDEYYVCVEPVPVNLVGAVILPYADSLPNLMGNDMGTMVAETELRELITATNDPIIFDGKFYWPEELLDELF